jgi:uncharacterized protein
MVFTFRKKGDDVLIRPISARYMHKKEVDAYEKEVHRAIVWVNNGTLHG